MFRFGHSRLAPAIACWILISPCAVADQTAADRKPNARKPDAATNSVAFACDRFGYVRHWAVTGPKRTLYTGPGGSDEELRREAVETAIGRPPREPVLGSPSPLGLPWRFYRPGQNTFVECSEFYFQPTVLDYYAVTELDVPDAVSVQTRLWAVGRADLWVNDTYVCRHDVLGYMRSGSMPVKLPLKQGRNRVCVRLQAFGVRDTRMLFGLQVLEDVKMTVRLPGPVSLTERLVQADRWLLGVKATGSNLVAKQAAPEHVTVRGPSGPTRAWPAGERRISADDFQVTVAVSAAGQTLERLLELPANQPASTMPTGSLDEHQRAYLEQLAADRSDKATSRASRVLANRLLKRRSDANKRIVNDIANGIACRKDCSDFTLAILLRLYALGLATDEESAIIKQTALGFRYWEDEPGTDAMWMRSENHSLLFHGCQLIAGRLFPNELFTNSGRTGAEQASIGADRCRAWLDKRERAGFSEYFSSTYMPITVGAMMNLVDFSGDPDISRRAAALVDRIFADLATHALRGVTIAPQGRVYRNVLYPQNSGTQALLSWATAAAPSSHSCWATFLASSATYQPPQQLDQLMREPVTSLTRQAGVEIALDKNAAYLLTSLQIPASFSGGLQPGRRGYQQHVWQASLARDCHVFVNHPGASFDQSKARPGYWYGNGTLPRLAQRGGTLMGIFDIPDEHPVGFTHAHWPSDAFEQQQVTEHWAFGATGQGVIALWCSEPLTLQNDVLSDRELRAYARRVAWLCVCGNMHDRGGFDGFKRACMALAPSFDATTRTLVTNQESLAWQPSE